MYTMQFSHQEAGALFSKCVSAALSATHADREMFLRLAQRFLDQLPEGPTKANLESVLDLVGAIA